MTHDSRLKIAGLSVSIGQLKREVGAKGLPSWAGVVHVYDFPVRKSNSFHVAPQ